MVVTFILALMAGYWSANGIPHYITGILGQEHPSPLGKSAVVNLLEGWASFLIGGVFWYFTWRHQSNPALVWISAAIGALAINLFAGTYALAEACAHAGRAPHFSAHKEEAGCLFF